MSQLTLHACASLLPRAIAIEYCVQRRACLIAGYAIVRAASLTAPSKFLIDLDQMKGKRLDNLTIIQRLRAGQQDALGRAAQIFRQRAIGQCFCQM